jgi:excisionase family DNA binding protein
MEAANVRGNAGGMEPLAFGINEAARLLGVSPGLVRLEIARGNLNPLRVGRRIVLTRTELDAYLARCATAAAPERHQPARPPTARNHGGRK